MSRFYVAEEGEAACSDGGATTTRTADRMSNLPWFKLYTESRTDRKLAGLTRAEKGVWIDLLCYAAEQSERGCFDASDRYSLAMEVADGDENLLNSTLEKLLKVRHLVACPTQGLYETSETSSNELKRVETTGNSLQRYMFRTFAQRQAQKVSHFPSDEKEKVNARVRKHRALKRQAKMEAQTGKSETSETTQIREREEEREYSLSGKVYFNTADADAHARAAPAAAAAEDHNDWTELEARRLAKRIAGRLRLTNPDIEALMAVLRQHRYAPAWLEAEAATCVEWYSAKKRKIDLRLFNNWLAKAEQRHREATLQEASLSNGHQHHTITTAATTTTGTDGITSSPDPGDALYQFNVERARQRARAKLVQ